MSDGSQIDFVLQLGFHLKSISWHLLRSSPLRGPFDASLSLGIIFQQWYKAKVQQANSNFLPRCKSSHPQERPHPQRVLGVGSYYDATMIFELLFYFSGVAWTQAKYELNAAPPETKASPYLRSAIFHSGVSIPAHRGFIRLEFFTSHGQGRLPAYVVHEGRKVGR